MSRRSSFVGLFFCLSIYLRVRTVEDTQSPFAVSIPGLIDDIVTAIVKQIGGYHAVIWAVCLLWTPGGTCHNNLDRSYLESEM
jgi:hypothetical protein